MNHIFALNERVFLLLNAQARAPHLDIAVTTLLASYAIAVVPGLLIALWIWGPANRWHALISTAIAAALALGANQILGQFWYEPRPFMVGLGHTLLSHSPENSFPSDHTTFILTVGLALITTGAARRWGAGACTLGVLVGWSRIYLGVHFPMDILTSALIATLFAALAAVISSPVQRWLARDVPEGDCRVANPEAQSTTTVPGSAEAFSLRLRPMKRRETKRPPVLIRGSK